jgi:flavin-dependent dehydrogenase
MLDVAVIGAGPAGSVAACLLARAGCPVTLIEQHRFPRDKVCGECISGLGIAVLRRVGLLERLRGMGAIPITHFGLHAPNGVSARIELPWPILGLSRQVMDQVLVEAAVEAGAKLRERVRCESLTPGNPPVLVLRDLVSNRIESMRPRYVVLADGKSALLGRRPGLTQDLGIKAHFADLDAPRDSVELFGVRGHYGGVAPVEEGLWNVAFSVPRRRVGECPSIEGLFERIIQENAALRRCFVRARRVGPWLSCPLPRFGVRRDWPEGVIPVGNAVAAIEPIGGEGMGLAMRSGELAARAIVDAVRAGALTREFSRLWRGRRIIWRALAWGVSRPGICGIGAKLLSCHGSLPSIMLEWIQGGCKDHGERQFEAGLG